MKQIMKRYVAITALIVAILILINGAMIYIWQQGNEEEYPREFSQLKNDIVIIDGACSIAERSADFIETKYSWAMIISNHGEIIYQYSLPEELNREYTMSDVAEFSKWYLEDYPTTTLSFEDGVIVLGNEKTSLWKKNISIQFQKIGILIVVMIAVNLAVGMFLAYIFSAWFSKSLKIVIKGISDLANNKKVNLPEKGYLCDVCKSVNLVSDQIASQWETIEKGNKMKSKWLAGVTHDIRTPLEIMVGNLDELVEIAQDEEAGKQLILVRNQCFKIKSLLADLNLINLLETKMKQRKMKFVKICKVVRDSMADIINMFDSPYYTYDFLYEDEVADVLIKADENLLKRAFSNLLINSIVHNEKGCNIKVSIKKKGDMLQINFMDDGIGVTEEKRKELCAIVDNAEESAHGWGIVVVKQIVDFHGGQIQFLDVCKGMNVQMIFSIEKS